MPSSAPILPLAAGENRAAVGSLIWQALLARGSGQVAVTFLGKEKCPGDVSCSCWKLLSACIYKQISQEGIRKVNDEG
jgi:hypothetical protein